jgi:hypothetical protein
LDPDPAFHVDADPDPDRAFHVNKLNFFLIERHLPVSFTYILIIRSFTVFLRN